MLRTSPQGYYVLKTRPVFVETIDKSYPWGVFDGSSAKDASACGARGILYFLDKLFFSFKAGLGAGTNNIAELCALKLLLTLAKMKDYAKIQVFGDSQLAINWAKGKFRMHNLELSLILQEVLDFLTVLSWRSFSIYIEKGIVQLTL